MKKHKEDDKFERKTPEELQFENEFLKLKLQAEFGASPVMVKKLPPEIENMFLKNIFKVEQAFAEQKTISIFDKIGRPEFAKADELNDEAIETALVTLMDLLVERGIFITFADDDSARDKYLLITNRIFNVEVEDVDIKETTIHFDLSDFDEEDDFEE